MIDLSILANQKALVAPIAAQYALAPALVCAVCEQESAWNAGDVRFEPGFLKEYVLKLNLPDLVALDRATSWGLMQIMGQTAVELGYVGLPSNLRDPATGVQFGCKKLAKCMDLHPGDLNAALEAYNGGGKLDGWHPATYAAEVQARMSQYF
jgi:soluble lytic murein transglycosylase-like protein